MPSASIQRGREHHPVLPDAAIAGLGIRPDGAYLDGTFGRGGHSRRILERLDAAGRLLAMDKDPAAIAAAALWADDPRFHIYKGSFANMRDQVEQAGLLGRIQGVLLDLGVSSPQLDQAERGFSFQHDGPLDMRMDPESGVSAAQWLAGAERSEVERVLRDLGEERFARRIAYALADARQRAPITRTKQLVALIAAAVPIREPGKHPATRSFQAIRIHVNQELQDLERGLEQSLDVLAPGGRLAVISFHSLEDRRVKRFMRDQARGERLPRGIPARADRPTGARLRLVSKAVKPDPQEIARNPRARSAVLRVAEKLEAAA